MTQTLENVRDEHDGYYWDKQVCPICDGEPTKFIGKRGGRSHRQNLGVETEIWLCERCDLVFPNPMPIPMGGLGQHYEVDADEYFKDHDKAAKLEIARSVLDRAEELLGRKGRLLDIGIGRGEILIEAKAHGWEVEGVEPSASFAEYAEKRIGVKIWKESIEDAAIPDDSFDIVLLGAVLEHLYDPDAVLAKLSKVLTRGGLLFLNVPNERGLYFRLGNLYERLRGRDWSVNLAPTFSPFHIFGFSPKSLRKILKKHGLAPKMWRVFGGTSLVSPHGGILGRIESLASTGVLKISNIGEMGTYIETWAVKE